MKEGESLHGFDDFLAKECLRSTLDFAILERLSVCVHLTWMVKRHNPMFHCNSRTRRGPIPLVQCFLINLRITVLPPGPIRENVIG